MQLSRPNHFRRAATRIDRVTITGATIACLTLIAATGCSSSGSDAASAAPPEFTALSDSERHLIEGIVTNNVPRVVERTIAAGQSDSTTPTSTTLRQVSSVDADGDTHVVLHPPSSFRGLDATDATIETWSDGAWLYIEYSGFSDGPLSMLDDPTKTPFDWQEPGVFKVDLDRIGDEPDLDPAEVEIALSFVTGQEIDLDPYVYFLAAHAGDAEPDPAEPSQQRLDATRGEVYADIVDVATSTTQSADSTVSTADPGQAEIDELSDRVPVSYAFSIDDDGRIDALTIDVDYSEVAAGAQAEPASEENPDRTATATTTYSIDYDPVDDITMPSGVDDDRTDAFIEWHGAVFPTETT